MKEYKYAHKYQVLKVENGNGIARWRVKRKSWIGIWFYMRDYYGRFVEFEHEYTIYHYIEMIECEFREKQRKIVEVKVVKNSKKNT